MRRPPLSPKRHRLVPSSLEINYCAVWDGRKSLRGTVRCNRTNGAITFPWRLIPCEHSQGVSGLHHAAGKVKYVGRFYGKCTMSFIFKGTCRYGVVFRDNKGAIEIKPRKGLLKKWKRCTRCTSMICEFFPKNMLNSEEWQSDLFQVRGLFKNYVNRLNCAARVGFLKNSLSVARFVQISWLKRRFPVADVTCW